MFCGFCALRVPSVIRVSSMVVIGVFMLWWCGFVWLVTG